jgi:hypothetical protein
MMLEPKAPISISAIPKLSKGSSGMVSGETRVACPTSISTIPKLLKGSSEEDHQESETKSLVKAHFINERHFGEANSTIPYVYSKYFTFST